MAKSGDDMSRLFRSLDADDTKFQASAKAAASEAEQRWPLFKAMAPMKPAHAPALSEQEKQHRNSAESTAGGARKPALSVPGLGGKLAASLDQMAAPKSRKPAAAKHPAPAEAPLAQRAALPGSAKSMPVAEPEAPPAKRRALFSKSPQDKTDAEDDAVGTGLFAKTAAQPAGEESAPPDSAAADKSLAGIFGRLEGKEEPAKKSKDTRPSFLGRLGKR